MLLQRRQQRRAYRNARQVSAKGAFPSKFSSLPTPYFLCKDFHSILFSSHTPSPLASDPIPLPSCQYKVETAGNSSSHDVSPAFVTIGDSVVHVWTCGEQVHAHIYCMQVCVWQKSSQRYPITTFRCIRVSQTMEGVKKSQLLMLTGTLT